MAGSNHRLGALLDALERRLGAQPAPRHTDPFQQVLFENVGYLVNDQQREVALQALRERVGLTPKAILEAPLPALREVAMLGGILPDERAAKLWRIAQIAQRRFKGDLRPLLRKPLAEACRELGRFPGIGEPGAEKILLLAGARPVLALDSNALRVLLRLGYGDEKKSYAGSYRSAQRAASAELRRDVRTLARAFLLLRRHGQEICKRSRPRCPACPLRNDCPYYTNGLAQ
jgi:endonuclease III